MAMVLMPSFVTSVRIGTVPQREGRSAFIGLVPRRIAVARGHDGWEPLVAGAVFLSAAVDLFGARGERWWPATRSAHRALAARHSPPA